VTLSSDDVLLAPRQKSADMSGNVSKSKPISNLSVALVTSRAPCFPASATSSNSVTLREKLPPSRHVCHVTLSSDDVLLAPRQKSADMSGNVSKSKP